MPYFTISLMFLSANIKCSLTITIWVTIMNYNNFRMCPGSYASYYLYYYENKVTVLTATFYIPFPLMSIKVKKGLPSLTLRE